MPTKTPSVTRSFFENARRRRVFPPTAVEAISYLFLF
jgi:hypothetical protein